MQDRNDQNRSGPSFNRRDFLKGSGAAVAATAIATSEQSAAAEQAQPKITSAGPVEITLNVNGQTHRLKLEPRVTLLEALRDDLNLTGCKHVDDTTSSGADTVIIDGKPILAGSRLAIECQGKAIQTIESLTQDGKVDEVIAGFVKHDATQCGYCTPGFVMATRAFLKKHPHATDEQIRQSLGGNLCRCGTYDGIRDCIRELAGKGGA